MFRLRKFYAFSIIPKETAQKKKKKKPLMELSASKYFSTRAISNSG